MLEVRVLGFRVLRAWGSLTKLWTYFAVLLAMLQAGLST